MYNDILKRLNNGESADAIAKELIDTLNKANAEYAAAQAEKAKSAEKIARLDAILKTLKTWIHDYYVTDVEDSKALDAAFDELDAEEIINLVERALKDLDAFTEAFSVKYEAPVAKKVAAAAPTSVKKPVIKVKELTAEEATKELDKFLKSMGW